MSHKLCGPWISGRISQRYLQIPKVYSHISIYKIVLVYLQRIIVSHFGMHVPWQYDIASPPFKR